MAIESLNDLAKDCASCKHLTSKCYKYKACAYCEKWKREVTDMLDTCFHYERNPDLPSIDGPVFKRKSKRERNPMYMKDYGL